jgi:hypothetical protein
MTGAIARVLARPDAHGYDYVFCVEDRFWFRPAYTEGKCPLCGAVAPGDSSALPLWRRMDRSWFGLAALTLESLGMLALVLFMYFRA